MEARKDVPNPLESFLKGNKASCVLLNEEIVSQSM
jgi:hypothetical protein